MDALLQAVSTLLLCLGSWVKYSIAYIQKSLGFEGGLAWVKWTLAWFGVWGPSNVDPMRREINGSQSEAWRTDQESRTYRNHGNGPMVAVQTSTHIFYVDLERLADCSEYFRALSHSCMKETEEHLVNLAHVPSRAFHSLLQFCFLNRFIVPENQIEEHLRLAEELCSVELQETVLTYLSKNLLELPSLSRNMELHLQQELLQMRSRSTPRLCCLRKENLISRDNQETNTARRLFRLEEEDGTWSSITELPFSADKWCFTTAVLFNYLYLIGGFRHRTKRGYEFKMASFRYNPLTDQWVPTAPLIKHRRHFSAAVCEGHIYAVGGWYLDSLVTPDSTTGVYTAVERYDPWADCWAFVSSLPLTDFQFTLSLSHDSP
ncbi:kelch repeat and BTB domain-containing protein 13 isoform X2 [Pygocentrus nattereri]|uniref:kelch repeat and BTB domain-containing protein 13 isoform X2 n=1 Tax=Pygocentrus nattereri TaxID=42514 RepID=UPI000EA5B7DB|nr:kelch repeat and BTB domain-containing protein 13 isoform X2 [Pygocentrus nattereri]